MRIVKLEKASAGRLFVSLEDGRCFPIGRREGKKLELEEDKDLTEEQIQWIYQELVFPRGRNYLICMLASRDYTIREVQDKLTKACYPEEIIADILRYGIEHHYLDDLRYAQDYMAAHRQSQSVRQIMYRLSRKGISDDVLSKLEAHNDPEELLPKVRRYWERREGSTYEKNGKTYQYFVRKGYDVALIRELIRTVSEQEA